MRKKKDARETEISDVLSLLERIAFVLGGHFAITGEGKRNVFHRDIDLSGAFGSVVVLDATSTINPSYTFHQKNSNNIQFMKRIDNRLYKNVTVHICKNKNLPQSLSALYSTPKKQGQLDIVVKQYLAIIEQILKPKDKLLVCTFKILVPLLKERCPFKNVKFIHWGSSAARGSNKYMKYNKAMAIGFFRKPQHIYNGAVLSIANYEHYIPTNGSISGDATQLRNHLIVDDHVQFFNRVRCRVSIDEEGNCKSTELYLFTEGKPQLQSTVEDLIRQEMPGITINEWHADADAELDATKKKNKLYKLAENVINWMLTVSYEFDIISQQQVMEYFGLTKKQMINLKKEPHFQNLCREEDIVEFKDGRKIMFKLPSNR